MNSWRATLGLCALCALLSSAIITQGATAAGTTAYTCKEGVGVEPTFNTSHCRPSDSAGKYGHFSIANNTTTELSGTNKNHIGEPSPWTLAATVFGTSIELKAQVVSSQGTIENREEGGEMIASGDGSITFTEAFVVKPSNCQVQTDLPGPGSEVGVIHGGLRGTTKGQGDRVKFEPKEGTVLVRFKMTGEGCALTGTYTVTGSFQGVPNGATVVFTESDTTAQETLKLNGAKAAVEGSLAIEGRDPKIGGDVYKPLSFTTGDATETEEEKTVKEAEEKETKEEEEEEEQKTEGEGTEELEAGTTAYTCKEGSGIGTTTFSTPHCKPSDDFGKYGLFSVANGTTTEVTGNNKDDKGVPATGTIVATLFGTTVELSSKKTEVTGTVANGEEGGEMYVAGEGTPTFREVSVVKPANCEVRTDILPLKEKGENGVFHGEPLVAASKGQGDRLKFSPKEGTALARFWMVGESCALKNTTFTVTGSVTGASNGATTEFTEADTTSQNTLKINGAKAGLSGSVTFEAKDPSIGGDTYKPLRVRT